MTAPPQSALPNDHPIMNAWNEFCDTDEFKNALRWAIETKYDDGRQIDLIQRAKHAKGSMWLAFIKGMECREAPALGEGWRPCGPDSPPKDGALYVLGWFPGMEYPDRILARTARQWGVGAEALADAIAGAVWHQLPAPPAPEGE